MMMVSVVMRAPPVTSRFAVRGVRAPRHTSLHNSRCARCRCCSDADRTVIRDVIVLVRPLQPDNRVAGGFGGDLYRLVVDDDTAPQVLRLCEYSHGLGGGTACLFQDALANGIAGGDEQEYSFTCPAGRSETEPGGAYTLYTTPLFDEGDSQPVSCTVVE